MVLSKDKIDWAKSMNEGNKTKCRECGSENFVRDKTGKFYCTKCGCFRN
jgi:ribosomal protein L37AE/L43A